jgi:DNA repair protein RecN (Recombination protein N)
MLLELSIKDFAIIDDLKLSLAEGFVVFTGETGAGKSIIIDAVEQLLGGRGDSALVRSGAEMALVEGVFRLDDAVLPSVRPLLERESLFDDPVHLTLSREIRREGRSVGRVNGRAVSLGLLRELGEWLVDVHGQSEHLSLLRVREHLSLLDRYGRVDDLRQAFAAEYDALSGVRTSLERLRQGERDAARRAEMLAYQIQEIEAAKLKPGEEESLREERTRLANAEQLAALADAATAALDESAEPRVPVTDLLGEVTHALQSLARIDPAMDGMRVEAQALAEQAAEVARRLRDYRESIEFNPRRLEEVEERLGLIHGLKRKYGADISEVLAYANRARADLDGITHAEERIQALEAEEQALLERLGKVGAELSRARQSAGKRLGRAIETELKDLRLSGARFEVDLTWQDAEDGAPVDGRRIAMSRNGLDRTEFMLAPNPGEGLKPLAKIASGGETSRLMLGLKGVLAQADRTPSLIFDEIDQGIGGRVGAIVGKKLWMLTQHHQVLCVTHLPQLAAFADQHLKVEKEISAGRTLTRVRTLSHADRIQELALMLGGSGQTNLDSARDLLNAATSEKTAASGKR